jgi:4-hydroxyphenylpyruvate dioxygenase
LQTALATVCLSGTLNEKLEAIAAAGFKGVEMFENDLASFDGKSGAGRPPHPESRP